MLTTTFKSNNFGGIIIWDSEKSRKTVKMNNPMYFQNEVNKFHVGDPVTMYLTNRKPKRSIQQNSYLWGVYYPEIMQETGETDINYLHEHFKQKFLKKGTKLVFGHEVSIYGSTTELTVGEFSDYVANIYAETHVMPPPTDNFINAPLISENEKTAY